MQLILKYKKEIGLFFSIGIIYFLLRLLFLDRMPLFTDEAIYIRWSQIALQDSSWRFISLTDGKQPMYVWFAMIFLKVVSDPLIAGRLVSVFGGFATLIGLWLLTFELFKSKKIAFLSSILYVFFPFAQVLDRMALYDSLVAAFFTWSVYFSVLLVRKLRLDLAYTLGLLIGAGVLTKSTNFFNIYLLPVLLILINYKEKNSIQKLVKTILYLGFSVIIAYGMYNLLRLSPLFQMIQAKNAVFVYPFSEWLMHPFTFFIGNFNGLASWFVQYLKLPYLVLLIVAYLTIFKFFKEKIILTVYFLLPFLALALFGKVIFPRFIFFMTVMLLPLCAYGLNYLIDFIEKTVKFKKADVILTISLVLIFVIYSGFVSLQFAIDPVNSRIAKADNNQYINSWAAGWGLKESVDYFRNQALSGKIFVATEGTFGLMPAGLEMYLVNNKNIAIKGYWPVDKFPQEVLDKAKEMPTYFVFYQDANRDNVPKYPLKLVFQVRQGNTDFYYQLYKVIPQ